MPLIDDVRAAAEERAAPSGGAEPALDDKILDQWSNGIERIRSTTKWVIMTFGAIGVILVGTAPLSGIAKAPDTRHAVIGWALAVIALAAIGLAVAAASRVLMPEVTTLATLATHRRLRGLRQAIDQEPASFLGVWADSVAAFSATWSRHLWTIRQLDRLLEEHADNPRETEIVAEARQVAIARSSELARAVQQVLLMATYYQVLERFRTARWLIFGGGALAAAGIVGYFASVGNAG